jgi:hypothetical protein
MKRRIVTTLASVALLAFVSTQAASTNPQTQDEQAATPRTGQKVTKPVQASCPVHPEVKARTAAKCPKCRMEERRQSGARGKDKVKVQPQPQQQEGAAANE